MADHLMKPDHTNHRWNST